MPVGTPYTARRRTEDAGVATIPLNAISARVCDQPIRRHLCGVGSFVVSRGPQPRYRGNQQQYRWSFTFTEGMTLNFYNYISNID